MFLASQTIFTVYEVILPKMVSAGDDIMAAIFPEKLQGFAGEFEVDLLSTVRTKIKNFKLELLKMLNARTKNNTEVINF